MRHINAFFGLLAAISMVPVASAESRIALIIGNGNYSVAGMQLPNPVNDAQAMNRALNDAGFETTVRTDVKRVEFYYLLRDFANKISKDKESIGLFYYAGHGIQADGSNYLIPVDADIQSVTDLVANAFDMDRVLRTMEAAQNDLNIVILDACRDNPLPKTRDLDRGLGRLLAPTGTFIGYATAPGRSAQDGAIGENGIFTSELVKAMSLPGLPIELMFKKVIAAVRSDTRGHQVPWQESSVQGDFYFHPVVTSGSADDPLTTANEITSKLRPNPATRGLSRQVETVSAPCSWSQPFPAIIATLKYRVPGERISLAEYQQALHVLTATMNSVDARIDACKVIVDNVANAGRNDVVTGLLADGYAHFDSDLLVIRVVADKIEKGLPTAESARRGTIKPSKAQVDTLLTAVSNSQAKLHGLRRESESNQR